MKKILVLGLIVFLSLSACSSAAPAAPAESVDIAATVDAAANTQVAATFAALATPTQDDSSASLELNEATATETATSAPSETPTLEPTTTETETASETPEGTLPAESATATADGTLPAETTTLTPDETLVATATGTLEAISTSIYPSPTSPISINQPPAHIPRYKIKIINKTKVKIYVSLQGVTEGGYHPIIEYDFDPWEKARFPIPEGKYTVIVYVGKDPMVGTFNIRSSNSVDIIIEKDRLTIKK